MQYTVITITAGILSTVTMDVANPRTSEFTPHRDIFASIAGNGWRPRMLGVADNAVPDHPILRLKKGAKLDAVLKSPKQGDLTILRGGHRIGTLLAAISGELPKGFAIEDRGKIASIIDHGDVKAIVVSDCSDKDATEIATDDDPLRRKWSVVHKYQQWRRLKACGISAGEAYAHVGYTNRYQHFDRLEKLGREVEQAWIAGKLGTKVGDKVSPVLTDQAIKEIYDLNGGKDAKGVELNADAKVLFVKYTSGQPITRATIASDKQLEALAKSLGANAMGELVQAIRGRDIAGNVITDGVRGEVFARLAMASELPLPEPDIKIRPKKSKAKV